MLTHQISFLFIATRRQRLQWFLVITLHLIWFITSVCREGECWLEKHGCKEWRWHFYQRIAFAIQNVCEASGILEVEAPEDTFTFKSLVNLKQISPWHEMFSSVARALWLLCWDRTERTGFSEIPVSECSHWLRLAETDPGLGASPLKESGSLTPLKANQKDKGNETISLNIIITLHIYWRLDSCVH